MMCVRRFVEVDDAGLRQWSRVPLISGLRSNKHKFVDFDNMSTCPSSMSVLPGVLSLRETHDVANSKGGAPHGRESFQGHGQVRPLSCCCHRVVVGLFARILSESFLGINSPTHFLAKITQGSPCFFMLVWYYVTGEPQHKKIFYVQHKKIFYAPRFLEPGDICQRLLIL